jgi:hypothetical protein
MPFSEDCGKKCPVAYNPNKSYTELKKSNFNIHVQVDIRLKKCGRPLALGEFVLQAEEQKFTIVIYVNGLLFGFSHYLKIWSLSSDMDFLM